MITCDHMCSLHTCALSGASDTILASAESHNVYVQELLSPKGPAKPTIKVLTMPTATCAVLVKSTTPLLH
jgi:hypothetical protein